jgi:hypothetical protein
LSQREFRLSHVLKIEAFFGFLLFSFSEFHQAAACMLAAVVSREHDEKEISSHVPCLIVTRHGHESEESEEFSESQTCEEFRDAEMQRSDFS